MDLLQPVVIDNGSASIKAGFSDKEYPQCVFPTIIGKPKYKRIFDDLGVDSFADAPSKSNFVGTRAFENRGILSVRNVYTAEDTVEADDLSDIFDCVYRHELKANAREHPLLLTEPALCSRRQKERIAQVLFETCGVPSIVFAPQPVLSLYASGKTTGVVVDVGELHTQVAAVCDGYTNTFSVQKTGVAGRCVTELLQKLLLKNGVRLTASGETATVRIIKEKHCAVPPSAASSRQKAAAQSVTLPDGSLFAMHADCANVGQLLFEPHVADIDAPSVDACVMQSVGKCAVDVRCALLANVVLAGGSTLFRGFGSRLLEELRAKTEGRLRVRVAAPRERLFSCWRGGAIVASMHVFGRLAVTAAAFDEDPGAVDRCRFF